MSLLLKKVNWFDSPTLPMRFREDDEVDPPSLFTEVSFDFPVIGLFSHYLLLDATLCEDRIALPDMREKCDGIFLIDLEAAHSRTIFEAFLSQIDKGGELQSLLIPLTLEFSPQESSVVTLHLEKLTQLGMAMRPFGEHCFIIDAIDPKIDDERVKDLIHELLEVFDQRLIEKEWQRKVAITACRYARSGKNGYTVVEAKQVLRELLKTPSPYQCPKGKRTIIHLGLDEIKRRF